MADVSTQHNPDLAHHVRQGIAWLSASAEGENTAALSYAAFELRFAIERLAVHYWRALLNRKPEEQDFRDIESFKRVERRIYALAGHQREIDAHFEFMRIVFGAMKIDAPLKVRSKEIGIDPYQRPAEFQGKPLFDFRFNEVIKVHPLSAVATILGSVLAACISFLYALTRLLSDNWEKIRGLLGFA